MLSQISSGQRMASTQEPLRMISRTLGRLDGNIAGSDVALDHLGALDQLGVHVAAGLRSLHPVVGGGLDVLGVITSPCRSSVSGSRTTP